MYALLVLSDGTVPDPTTRAALLGAGIDAREPPAGDAARASERPDLLLVAVPGSAAEALAALRQARANPLLGEAPALVAVDRRELGAVLPGAGADDFVCLPLDAQELVARARFLLFRARRVAGDGLVSTGDLTIDTRRYEVRVGGRRIDLTLKEYELLLFLAQHKGQVFTREVLLDRIWGQEYFGGTRTVDVHVRRIRAKFERHGCAFVDTVRGVGYKLDG